jgi:branched-subunit amino acid aminotransferase/4-amino-4-deoxychorismate lyase
VAVARVAARHARDEQRRTAECERRVRGVECREAAVSERRGGAEDPRTRADDRDIPPLLGDPVVENAPLGDSPASWSYAISPRRLNSADQLLRHKSSWREFYDHEQARLAAIAGCDETIFLNERGELTEGSRTSIFVSRGDVLVTPPLDAGVLDGVLRRELIETGKCREGVLTVDDLRGEVFLGNSLRGLIATHPVQASARARVR